MDTHIIISSQTYAEKARHLLNRYRYSFRLQKTVTQEGCVYRLTVSAPPDAVLPLLTANGIPCRQERS